MTIATKNAEKGYLLHHWTHVLEFDHLTNIVETGAAQSTLAKVLPSAIYCRSALVIFPNISDTSILCFCVILDHKDAQKGAGIVVTEFIKLTASAHLFGVPGVKISKRMSLFFVVLGGFVWFFVCVW